MRKLYMIFFFGIVTSYTAQSWSSDDNIFNNSQRTAYEDLSKKKEREINRDMNNVKTIINKSTFIYEHFKEENAAEEQKSFFGPGAPGEPVPIDRHLNILWIAGILFCFAAIRKKQY